MKSLTVSIETHGDVSTVQIKSGRFFAAAIKRWNGKPKFPFGTVVKCAFKIWKNVIKHKLNKELNYDEKIVR